ncbi:MAG: PilZ domain-containing protein [Gammaproteobacteria bacterium]|nr:PilZ domain-containing protein [Gammaproteobacteria bacterium]
MADTLYNYKRSFSEKRDFMRMQIKCPVTFSEIDSDVEYQGTCINLSAKGVLIQAKRRFPEGTRLAIFVQPELAISPNFSATIEVIRTEVDADASEYRFAGRIEEISVAKPK